MNRSVCCVIIVSLVLLLFMAGCDLRRNQASSQAELNDVSASEPASSDSSAPTEEAEYSYSFGVLDSTGTAFDRVHFTLRVTIGLAETDINPRYGLEIDDPDNPYRLFDVQFRDISIHEEMLSIGGREGKCYLYKFFGSNNVERYALVFGVPFDDVTVVFQHEWVVDGEPAPHIEWLKSSILGIEVRNESQ